MIKRYRNQIFQHLLNHSLGVDNFEIEEDAKLKFTNLGNVKGTLISYKPFPKLAFAFVEVDDSFDYFYPASADFVPNIMLRLQSLAPLPFAVNFNHLNRWLDRDVSRYREDEQDVDLWTAYQERIDTLNLSQINYEDATNFTLEEQQGVKLALQQLEYLINERFAKEDSQRQIIGIQIKYLTERAEHLSKTDWKGIMQNTLISIIITLSLDTQKGAELLALVIEVFKFTPGLLHLK